MHSNYIECIQLKGIITAMKIKNLFVFASIAPFLLASSSVLADGSDYWSQNKTMNLPSGVATTSCTFYNNLDQAAEQTVLMNEIYKRWLKGWVSSFAMYSDWDIRDIKESEYLEFIQMYCDKFPSNTLGMAAHTFTYRVKR
jgi:hypothetical protein